MDKQTFQIYKWILITVAVIYAAITLFLLITSGFSWVLLIPFVILLAFLGVMWFVLWLINKYPFRSTTMILTVIFAGLLFASIKNYQYGDALYTLIDQHIRIEYFVGAVDVFALLIAIVAIYEQQRGGKERNTESQNSIEDFSKSKKKTKKRSN